MTEKEENEFNSYFGKSIPRNIAQNLIDIMDKEVKETNETNRTNNKDKARFWYSQYCRKTQNEQPNSSDKCQLQNNDDDQQQQQLPLILTYMKEEASADEDTEEDDT